MSSSSTNERLREHSTPVAYVQMLNDILPGNRRELRMVADFTAVLQNLAINNALRKVHKLQQCLTTLTSTMSSFVHSDAPDG